MLPIPIFILEWRGARTNITSRGVQPSSSTVAFYVSLGIVFGGTMWSFISFDGVSKDRASGVLEIKLSQLC